jgi:hypothetical protein
MEKEPIYCSSKIPPKKTLKRAFENLDEERCSVKDDGSRTCLTWLGFTFRYLLP